MTCLIRKRREKKTVGVFDGPEDYLPADELFELRIDAARPSHMNPLTGIGPSWAIALGQPSRPRIVQTNRRDKVGDVGRLV